MPFEYFHDKDKTKGAQHPKHPNWSALGDVGYIDDEGYLFLTDRATFMIISGGVNIYPQEIEDAMVMHPKVADVAVVGVPNEEMGEEVKAVVQLAPGMTPSPAVAGGADRVRARTHRALQMSAQHRLRGGVAAVTHRQAVQADAERPVLG